MWIWAPHLTLSYNPHASFSLPLPLWVYSCCLHCTYCTTNCVHPQNLFAFHLECSSRSCSFTILRLGMQNQFSPYHSRIYATEAEHSKCTPAYCQMCGKSKLRFACVFTLCILLFHVWHGWMRLPLASDSKQWQKCKSFRLTSSSSTSLVRIINRPGAIRMPFPLHKIKYTRVYAVCVCLCIMHSSIAITFSFSI